MKKITSFAAAITALSPLLLVSPAYADLALATAKGCTACHSVDKKIIGPSYGQVAGCYATKDAKKLAATKLMLAKHVKEGGAGNWGPIPMPANPAVSAEDITKIVDWVMAAAPLDCPDKFTELAKAKAAKP